MTKKIKDKDYEMEELFISLGMMQTPAKIVRTMLERPVLTARELEIDAKSRQPEVSIAMKGLVSSGWVTESEEKLPGKGRPHKVYRLKITVDEIIKSFEDAVAKDIAAFDAAIMKLKGLAAKKPDVPAKEL